jgi:multimeric flavodoxin WrbA
MNEHSSRVTAILGTYRKGGIIDQAVDAILDSAKDQGAETAEIYLIDKHIEFCTNCRMCTQQEGPKPGQCPIEDDMSGILAEIERSDAIILASPMNFWTVTAIMKRFIERLVCFAYWPWGKAAPKLRNKLKNKRAVIVTSSACPALLARLFTKISGLMKGVTALLGAKNVGVLRIGFAATEQHQALSERTRKKARWLGKKLVGR